MLDGMMRFSASPEEKAFFKQLGARIAGARKEHGWTQAQLAELVGYSQQQIDAFEKGRCRMYVTALASFSKIFGVTTEELLGLQNGAAKRGPTSRLQQQLERLSRLPRSKQRVVTEILEGYLQRAS